MIQEVKKKIRESRGNLCWCRIMRLRATPARSNAKSNCISPQAAVERLVVREILRLLPIPAEVERGMVWGIDIDGE